MKYNYRRATHKFGIRFPKNGEGELRVEKEAGNDYWEKSLNTDMSKVKVSWKHVDVVTPDQER